MDYMTALQNGQLPGSGVPIQQQPQNLGDFQMAMRQWLMQRQQPQDMQGWLAQRPDPHQYMAQGQGPFQGAGSLGDLMAQHPGRNWHPSMIIAQRYQNGM